MVNLKTISKIIGTLLFIEAFLMVCCLGVAFYFKEDDFFAFLVSTFITVGTAFLLKYYGRDSDNVLSRRDSYLVVTLAWTIFSLFGTLPFIISGHITDFTDALFENVAGFTTTGTTILRDIEKLSHGLLFWRSLSQWVGSLGIVFFTIALLPSMSGGSVRVFAAEATGPLRTRLHPHLSTSAMWIWSIYLMLTIACSVSYIILGMDWFDGVNYGMTTTATGGFSTHNGSLGIFQSAGIEYACTFFCFLAGVNFTLLYSSIIKLKPAKLFRDDEFKFYIILIALAVVVIMAQLMAHNHYDLEKAFRTTIFHVVSFFTTAGIFNDNLGEWPRNTFIILTGLMVLGACSGSTSGGLKCIRGVMLLKIVRNEMKQILHPNAVLPLRINEQNVTLQKRVTLLAFITTYVLVAIIAYTAITIAGINHTNAVTIVLSCMSNTGPSLDMNIGPVISWAMLPKGVKWLCMTLMLIGRLEIFSVLVIFTPEFWKRN